MGTITIRPRLRRKEEAKAVPPRGVRQPSERGGSATERSRSVQRRSVPMFGQERENVRLAGAEPPWRKGVIFNAEFDIVTCLPPTTTEFGRDISVRGTFILLKFTKNCYDICDTTVAVCRLHDMTT